MQADRKIIVGKGIVFMSNNESQMDIRLRIGKAIYNENLSVKKAAEMYGIDPFVARDYLRLYKKTITGKERS